MMNFLRLMKVSFFYLNKWVYYDRTDISEGSDPAKSKKSKDCHYL